MRISAFREYIMKFPFELLQGAEFDVIGFGTNAVDHLIRVPEYPRHDSKVELTGYAKEAGGEAASTMVGLKRLGHKTAYVGRFGRDEAGEFGRCSLVDEGVDVSYTEMIDGASTQVAFIIIDEVTGERTVIWHRDKRLSYDRSEAPVAAATLGRILHITPHDVLACIEMADAARKNKVIVSIDIDNIFDGVEGLLPMVDIITAAADFFERLTGLTDEKKALSEIRSRFGCGLAGITRGRAGSIILCDGVFMETNGFEVPIACKDTTGAGDAFRAGLLHGLLSGEPIAECARFANAVAALKCRELGARRGLPDKQELTMFLK